GLSGGHRALDHRARAEHVAARGERARLELAADDLEALPSAEILEAGKGGFVLAEREQRAAKILDGRRVLGRAFRRALEAGQRIGVLAALVQAERGAEQVLHRRALLAFHAEPRYRADTVVRVELGGIDVEAELALLRVGDALVLAVALGGGVDAVAGDEALGGLAPAELDALRPAAHRQRADA